LNGGVWLIGSARPRVARASQVSFRRRHGGI